MTPDVHERSALGRLAGWAFKHRAIVLVAWLVALVGAFGLGAAAGGEYSADYRTPGSQSKAASDLLQTRFDDRSAESVDVVWTAPGGARSKQATATVDRVLAQGSRLEGFAPMTRRAAQGEISPDGSVGVVRLQLAGRPDEVPVASGEELRRLAESASRDGVQVELGGGFVEGIDEEGEVSSEMVGIAVAALVLLLTFGTLVAAGLPLATALFGLGISSALFGVLAALTDTPDWAPALGTMIGLGVGIDYALLILTRHRSAMRAGKQPRDAAVEALATAGRSTLIAGGTVVISLVGLFLMGLPYLYGAALAAMIAVFVVMAASVTLLPALLGVMGTRVNSLRIPGAGRRAPLELARTPSARWARAVQRRPLVAAVAATALLVVLAAPVTGLRLGFPDAGNNREETTSRQAYDLLAKGFGAGANGPLLVVAETPDRTDQAAFARLGSVLRSQPGVQSVAPVQSNAAGDAAMIAITPRSSPQDERTEQLVHDLRDGPLARSGLDNIQLGGATAQTIDQGEATADRLPLFIGGVLGLSFLLLLFAFRAPLVALKAGAMNLLSIGAAYGVIAWFAEGGWAGQLIGIDTATPVPPFIPVLMFAILFGLSMDYEVFLLSRVREEHARHGNTARAVVDGLAKTARVITAAAAIMVAVFGAFALSPEVFLKLIGVGLATAILIDATVVRMVLVPAVMQLLGDRNWWLPTWLDRVLPRARLEAPEPAPARA